MRPVAHIESIIIHVRSVPLVRPFVTAVRRADAVDALLVEVRDSDGRSGWGEAPTSWRVTGESHASVSAAVDGPLGSALRGLPVDDPQVASSALVDAVVGNPSARMAVECAVWDLAARAAGTPLHRYLGGSQNAIETDMTLSAAASAVEADDLVRTAMGHVADGFTTLKVKTGAGADDAALLRRVRAAVGDAITLRVDANQAWSADEAVRIINGWHDDGVNIELVEQPVPRDDIAGLAHVNRSTQTPIVADESVWISRHLRELLAQDAVSRINIKLAKTGGIAEALRLGRLARHHDVGVFVGCMSEGPVGIAAAAAVASALLASDGVVGAQDLDAGLWLSGSPVLGGASYRGNRIVLSDAPGTGIQGLDVDTADG